MAHLYPSGRMPAIGYLMAAVRTRGWPYAVAWAHRITGVMLVIYGWLHILTLASLRNPEIFARKMAFFSKVMPVFVEWFLAVPVIFHALNGGRLVLYEVLGNRKDSAVLKWVLIISGGYLALLGFFMALGNQTVSALFFWAYLAVAAALLTYFVAGKLRRSGASAGWKLQRITGVFMLLMIPGHMLFMHLDPEVGRNSELIIARMNHGFIKLVDLSLVLALLYHGGYGLIEIGKDYLSSRRAIRTLQAAVVVVTLFFAWKGVTLIVLV